MSIPFKTDELRDKRCPRCQRGLLRRVIINGQPAAYYCIARRPGERNCKLKFDVSRIETTRTGEWVVRGQAENPAYVEKLNSSSFERNLSISVQLERENVPFFLEGEYILEQLSRSEVRRISK